VRGRALRIRSEDQVKRTQSRVQLSEEQQVILAVLLVVLLAISMLYCLGLASVAMRHNLENTPLPWNGTELPEEGIELPSLPSPTESTGAAPPPLVAAHQPGTGILGKMPRCI
jgi:hypothetical protein